MIKRKTIIGVVLLASVGALLIYHIIDLRNQLSTISDRLRELEESFEALKTLTLSSNYDEYGGLVPLKGQNTGFFHTEKISEKFWLVGPEGNLFISKGVNPFDGLQRYSLSYSTLGGGGSGRKAGNLFGKPRTVQSVFGISSEPGQKGQNPSGRRGLFPLLPETMIHCLRIGSHLSSIQNHTQCDRDTTRQPPM